MCRAVNKMLLLSTFLWFCSHFHLFPPCRATVVTLTSTWSKFKPSLRVDWVRATDSALFSDNNISTALWTDQRWNAEWLKRTKRLRWFIPALAPTLLEWPCQEQRGSGLTAFAPLSDVSTPAYINWVWPLLRLVSVAKRNRLLTMLFSNVQSIDLPMERMSWRFWMSRQSNGCSTPAPRSNAAVD